MLTTDMPPRPVRKRNARFFLQVVIFLCAIAGCASDWNPIPADTVPFRERAQTQGRDGIRVTAAVPSAAETREIFGADLYDRGVQPVWLEIENTRDKPVAFLPVGLDANYFTPIETASMHESEKNRQQMEQYFFGSRVNSRILPGATRSGFVFTHLDEGTKAFNVDLVSSEGAWPFTFFIQVPGLKVDHYDVDFVGMYTEDQIGHLDRDGLIAWLEASPCCVRNEKDTDNGDPLNIAVIGDPKDVYYAFIRAGWDETEIVAASSGFKTAISFLTGGEYRYSPVSSLYVFNRRQDVAFQRARANIHERNHLRLWMSPYKYEGKAVWIGQISRDIGVRFTPKTITTHKIDPDVDETREFLLENLAYNQVLAKVAYVKGTGPAPIEQMRGNLTGDPYFTDGLRIVLWVSSTQVAIDDIELLQWEIPQR